MKNYLKKVVFHETAQNYNLFIIINNRHLSIFTIAVIDKTDNKEIKQTSRTFC